MFFLNKQGVCVFNLTLLLVAVVYIYCSLLQSFKT